MKTVFVLLDSLNRNAMSCYREEPAHTPNFSRFADRASTFDSHCVGSLPCIPARRDLLTSRFAISDLVDATLVEPFLVSKGVPLLKLIPRNDDEGVPVEAQGMSVKNCATALYDLETDPMQSNPLDAPVTEAKLSTTMARLMHQADAPKELFARFGLAQPKTPSDPDDQRRAETND